MNESDRRLIELVKHRPILWNSDCCALEKEKLAGDLWKEVFVEFEPDFVKLWESQQLQQGIKIVTRWYDLREMFLLCVHAGKRHTYHEELAFLLSELGNNPPKIEEKKADIVLPAQEEESVFIKETIRPCLKDIPIQSTLLVCHQLLTSIVSSYQKQNYQSTVGDGVWKHRNEEAILSVIDLNYKLMPTHVKLEFQRQVADIILQHLPKPQ